MKVRIELIEDDSEEEIVIRCSHINDSVQKIQQYIKEQSAQNVKITYYKENEEFYFSVEQILFFETEDEHIYAHTKKDSYRIKYRLYELEELLPRNFIRSSKSTIINCKQIYSITRNIASSSLVTFKDSHKHVYVSRNYYKQLQEQMRKE